MKFLYCLLPFVCILLLAACGAAEATPTPAPIPTPAPTTARQGLLIVAMGDSLTEGLGVDPADAYPAQLERKLRAAGYDVTVANAGVSGETSSGALARVDWVLRQEPDIVILATGGNDGLRGVEPAVTAENIDQIVQKLQASGAVVVLAGMEMVQNMGTEFTSEFRALYPAIAARRGVILMPFLLQDVATDPDLNQPDFIHPTAAGYTIVVENLYPYVVQAIEQVQAQP
jgi:acyl-CoA thioesterase-1